MANQQGVIFIAYITHICGIFKYHDTTKIQMHVSVSWAGRKMNETGWLAQTMQ